MPRAVTKDHRLYLLKALAEIQSGPELEVSYVESQLQVLRFPGQGQTKATLASSRMTPELAPYQALICLTAAPHHLSHSINVLEYKILDGARSTQGDAFFPLHYSVFPNGRRVLGVSGLLLDTAEQITEYERGSMLEDKFKVSNPSVLKIFEQVILSFPQGSGKLEVCRASALMDLRTHGLGSEACH